jgi:hypothetical protein
MCIEAQNTGTICLIRCDYTTYSFFSSRMCIEAQNTTTICSATQAPPHPGAMSPAHERLGPTILPRKHHLTQAPRHLHASA